MRNRYLLRVVVMMLTTFLLTIFSNTPSFTKRDPKPSEEKLVEEALVIHSDALKIRVTQPEKFDKATYDKEINRAVKKLEKAIKINPKYVRAYLTLAAFYSIEKKFEKAESTYQKAIKVAPDSAEAHLYFGTYYYRHYEYDKAIKELNKALKIEPDNQKAIQYVKKIKSIPEEKRLKQKALSYELAAHKVRKIDRAKYDELLDKAIKQYEKVIEINPKDMEAYYDLAGVYLLKGVPRDKRWLRKAEDTYKKVIAINPGHARAHLGLARYYYGQGSTLDIISYDRELYEKAKKGFNRVLELDPGNKEALKYLKKIEKDEATACYREKQKKILAKYQRGETLTKEELEKLSEYTNMKKETLRKYQPKPKKKE